MVLGRGDDRGELGTAFFGLADLDDRHAVGLAVQLVQVLDVLRVVGQVVVVADVVAELRLRRRQRRGRGRGPLRLCRRDDHRDRGDDGRGAALQDCRTPRRAVAHFNLVDKSESADRSTGTRRVRGAEDTADYCLVLLGVLATRFLPFGDGRLAGEARGDRVALPQVDAEGAAALSEQLAGCPARLQQAALGVHLRRQQVVAELVRERAAHRPREQHARARSGGIWSMTPDHRRAIPRSASTRSQCDR